MIPCKIPVKLEAIIHSTRRLNFYFLEQFLKEQICRDLPATFCRLMDCQTRMTMLINVLVRDSPNQLECITIAILINLKIEAKTIFNVKFFLFACAKRLCQNLEQRGSKGYLAIEFNHARMCHHYT